MRYVVLVIYIIVISHKNNKTASSLSLQIAKPTTPSLPTFDKAELPSPSVSQSVSLALYFASIRDPIMWLK